MALKQFIGLFQVCLLLSGCASISGHESAKGTASTASLSACLTSGQWYHGTSFKPLSAPDLYRQAANTQIILLGERHDNEAHHQWQLQTLAAIHAYNPDMAIGFEAFPRSVQTHLDAWSGPQKQKTLSQEQFLKNIQWQKIWGFDPSLYMPLFTFARRNTLPIFALNIERSLVSLVRKEGYSVLPEALQKELGTPAAPPEPYLAMLEKVYGHHVIARAHAPLKGRSLPPSHDKLKTKAPSQEPSKKTAEHTPKMPAGHTQKMPSGHGSKMPSGHGSKMNLREDQAFQRFVKAQSTWDRAFAAALAQAAAQQDNGPVIGIIGSGHLDFGHGVAHQLADLGVTDQMTFLPKNIAPGENCMPVSALEPGEADAFFLLDSAPAQQAKPKPRLGIMIQTAQAGGLEILGLSPEGVGAKAGLKKGDRLLTAAGQVINSPSDLVAIIDQMPFGTHLPLTIRRQGRSRDLIARFPALGEK